MTLISALLGLSGLAMPPLAASDALTAASVAQSNSAFRLQSDNRRQPRRQSDNRPMAGGRTFNYTHVSLWTGTEELDGERNLNPNPEADAMRFTGAIRSGRSNFIFLDWQEGEYDTDSIRTTRELGMGVAEQYSASTSFFFGVSYLQDQWENPGSPIGSNEDEREFLRGRYGVRMQATDRIELDGAIVYTQGTGSTNFDSRWSMDLGLSVYITENIALRAVGTDIDGIRPAQMYGVRVEFGGN
jgi:hypothetical protein